MSRPSAAGEFVGDGTPLAILTSREVAHHSSCKGDSHVCCQALRSEDSAGPAVRAGLRGVRTCDRPGDRVGCGQALQGLLERAVVGRTGGTQITR